MRLLLLIAGGTLAACSPPAATTTTSSMSDTAMTTGATTSAVDVMGRGVITALNTTTHTVTFNHEAIDAIHWPAMTMTFTAENPAILDGLAVGDHVTFQLKSVAEPGTVVAIQKQ